MLPYYKDQPFLCPKKMSYNDVWILNSEKTSTSRWQTMIRAEMGAPAVLSPEARKVCPVGPRTQFTTLFKFLSSRCITHGHCY